MDAAHYKAGAGGFHHPAPRHSTICRSSRRLFNMVVRNQIGDRMARRQQTARTKSARSAQKSRHAPAVPPFEPPAEQRLQKILAAAGIASRRECEQIILEGRVEVDGELVTTLGAKADPQASEIRLDGQLLPKVAHVYFLVNKPRGVVSTSRDPSGRPRVIDLVPPQAGRVFTVGRLDKESEGLMLLTNDGELANRLAHPRYGIKKVYRVQVAGTPGREVLAKLRQGVRIAEGVARAEWAKVKRKQKLSTIIELVLREGKNREIRRMLAALGHKVQRLRRVSIGDVLLGKLPIGDFRELTARELRSLRRAAGFAAVHKGTGRRR